MSGGLRYFLQKERGRAGLVLAFLVAGLVAIVGPQVIQDDIKAIRFALAIVASALGVQVVLESLSRLSGGEETKIGAFFSNRRESRGTWRGQIAEVRKTLIVSGATAQVLLIETDDIKRIVREAQGRVVILAPDLYDARWTQMYEDVIHASGLNTGLKDMRENYRTLVEELSGEVEHADKRIVLVEHLGGPPFGMTMYDPEDRAHGRIRVELYGFSTGDRPAFDVPRQLNPSLYRALCRSVSAWLGFDPSERGPTDNDVERWDEEKNQRAAQGN